MERLKRCCIALALLMALLVSSGAAMALGLGEARVDSYLNQSLEVTVRLIDASDAELESLTVRTADPADFERLGIMSESLALGLDVSLDRSANPPVIRVTSEHKASDPVVQILLDARWANGRVLREYTLFLDPPTLDTPPPARPARSPAAEEPAPVREQSAETPSVPPARPASRTTTGEYGPVASGETLWGIARDWRPDPSLSMNQVMLAILERNPGAFRDNNVNHLLRGARLQMPSAEEIAAIDADEAAVRVREQSERFRTRTLARESVPVVSDSAVPAEEAPAAVAAAGEPDASAVEHRLELVPPREDETAGGSAGEDEALSRMQENLARMEEELFAARLEADELRERLVEMEMFLAEEGRRLGLPDEELAAFQQALRESRTSAGDDDPDVSEAVRRLLAEAGGEDTEAGAGDAMESGTGAATDSEAAGAADAPVADEVADEAAQAPADSETERRVTQVGSPEGSLFDRLVGSWLLWAALLLMLVALVVLAWRMIAGRRETGEAPVQATAGASLEAARRQVQQDPEDLNSHLALLRLLAAREDEAGFAAVLEDMFGYVNTGQERQWRDALRLASTIVPEHALVAGSVDAVSARDHSAAPGAGQDAGTGEEGDPEIEGKTRDILRILDEDRAEAPISAEDNELTGIEETPEPPLPELGGGPEGEADEPASPDEDDEDWLRDVGRGTVAPSPEEAGEPTPEQEAAGDDGLSLDLDFDMSDLEDPDPAQSDSVESGEDEPAEESELEAFLKAHETDRESEATDGDPVAPAESGDDTGPSLDWEPAGTGPGEPDSEEPGEAAPEPGDEGEPEDDIFSLGEDDVEVKLDLARAYISMDDPDAARTMLEEVLDEGSESQQEQARKLLDELG